MWMNPQVQSFYDSATSTFTHVVYDHDGGRAAIVDPVLDYDPAQARTSTVSADRVLAFVDEHALSVDWILETHAHADHLTAAAYLKRKTGARVAIGHSLRSLTAVLTFMATAMATTFAVRHLWT
ncbi:MBL fold metallo-hydrolase [Xanthomonas vesicatoria]|uniref:MBL fold metallo-hydrolase n=1 Tax=Xanthomonas vesicatoria TaxID=56460 RepID=UPI001E5B9204|nr:MBL fold metallo-hydrolase [Xanthomonas vesicatoria]MCC8618733.1 MBL fold metallo-hydrolase [Xanthomonas vesicatoria]MCC8630457.1 MBL fold metallo-hydrolase [Xanthomonas vesicatoria]